MSTTLKLLTVFTLPLGSYNFEMWGLRQTAKSLPSDSAYITCPNTRLPEGRLVSASQWPFQSSHPPNPVLGMASVPWWSVSELWVTWRPEPSQTGTPPCRFTLSHWGPQAELVLPHPNPKLGLSNKKWMPHFMGFHCYNTKKILQPIRSSYHLFL